MPSAPIVEGLGKVAGCFAADVAPGTSKLRSILVDRLVAALPNAAALKESIVSHHTSTERAGRVAEAAGVKTLVLAHFVPAEDANVTDQMWFEAARSTYGGQIIVGRDLLEI